MAQVQGSRADMSGNLPITRKEYEEKVAVLKETSTMAMSLIAQFMEIAVSGHADDLVETGHEISDEFWRMHYIIAKITVFARRGID